MSDPRIEMKFNVENNAAAPEEPRDWYPKSAAQELVRKFHAAFGAPVGDSPRSIGAERGFLRKDMLQEELNEFADAVDADDIVEQFDALIDILVLAYGGLVEMGIDAGPGKVEVMRANMSKLDEHGLPIISRGMELDGFPEGKILKGPNYVAPDLFKVLVEQGWTPTYKEYLDYYGLKDPTETLKVLAGKPAVNGGRLQGPHEFVKVLSSNDCVCGKDREDISHRVTDLSVDWDIDRNAPRRKDNFRDAVMNGWKPDTASQIRYERHRQELDERYPNAAYDVTGDFVMNVYRNGEKDVDWDFEAKAPRVKVEGPNE